MAVSVVTSPDSVSNVRNPIIFIINSNAVGVVEIQLKLYYNNFNEVSGTELVTLRAPVDSNGDALFYIERYLRDILTHQLPDLSIDTAQPLLGGAKQFSIDYSEFVDGVAGGTGGTSEFVVVLAGFAFWLFPGKATELPRGFLASNKPQTRYMPTNVPDWIYIFSPIYSAANGLGVDYTIYYTDLTTDVISETYPDVLDDPINEYQVVAFPIGWQQKQYETLNPAKTIDYIEVAISTLPVITLRAYETEPWYQRAFYYFSRTTGGLESVFLRGEQSETIVNDKTKSPRLLPYNYTSDFAQIKTDYNVPRQRYKASTGIMDEDTFNAVKEMLMLESGFVLLDEKLVAINFLTDTKELPSDNDTMHGFEIEYELAHYTAGLA